jgi:hypothetical protein
LSQLIRYFGQSSRYEITHDQHSPRTGPTDSKPPQHHPSGRSKPDRRN